nr:cupin domain-containing protein [Paraburkholderia flagellata]
MTFESQRPHAWKADGDEPTVLVWVNTPKSF